MRGYRCDGGTIRAWAGMNTMVELFKFTGRRHTFNKDSLLEQEGWVEHDPMEIMESVHACIEVAP